MAMDLSIKTIDDYISRYPKDVQAKLQSLREAIQKVAPEATEKISYGLATFVLRGNLVHFGAYDTHIGFYPGSGPVAEFADELKPYETSKGTVRFPLDQPLPLELITRMTNSAVKRNLAKKR
jgi:uncharacterized protein YdhG (YjbR/CyaY superfamily)